MNILTKIFIVLLVVLTIAASVAVIIVNRDYRKWKPAYEALQQQLKEANQSKTVLDDQLKQARADGLAKDRQYQTTTNSQQEALTNLQGEVSKRDVQIAGLNGQVQSMTVEKQNLERIVAQNNELIKKLEAEVTSTHARLTDISVKYTDVSEQANGLQARNDYLSKQIKLQDEAINELRRRLQEAGQTTTTGQTGQPAVPEAVGPPIKGEITAVGDDHAVISVGKVDGVVPGMKFTVFRGGKYLAEMVVIKVEADSSVGRLQLVEAQVQVHDKAWNRLDPF
ncbi:MAG: hypothetical protein BIFFINMI_01520 [Phycisphaerae bacterium]|nr:hypothetical protein [Phycisphaerae bacterium]